MTPLFSYTQREYIWTRLIFVTHKRTSTYLIFIIFSIQQFFNFWATRKNEKFDSNQCTLFQSSTLNMLYMVLYSFYSL
jgi:hypothetical protein